MIHLISWLDTLYDPVPEGESSELVVFEAAGELAVDHLDQLRLQDVVLVVRVQVCPGRSNKKPSLLRHLHCNKNEAFRGWLPQYTRVSEKTPRIDKVT